MKNLSLTSLTLLALFLLSSLNISSAVPDFQVDGIYYKITSIEDRECCVFGRVSSEERISRLVVPATVRFNGASFTVVGVYGDVDNVSLSNSHFENITEIIFPNTVKWIGEHAFSSTRGGVRELESIKMDGVEKIHRYAFKDCNRLETISTALNKLKYLGDGCFMDTRVSLVIIPPSCKEVGISAFADCCNRNYSVIIQDSDEPLMCQGGMGFYKDYTGQKIYIGRNIWSEMWIGNSGEKKHYPYRSDIYNFREIEYGDKVTEMLGINPKRYYSGDLENLPFKITIGASIKEVPDFSNEGIMIKSLYLVSAKPPHVKGTFSNRTYLHGTLYVPKGSLAAYKDAPVWKNFLNIQEYETDRTIAANKEYFAQRKKEEAQKAEAKRKAEEEAKHKAEAREAAAKRTMDAMEAAERYAKEIEDRMKARQEQERDLSHIDSTPNETQVPKKSQNSANRNSQTLMPVEKSKGKSQPEIDILDMNNTTPFNVIKWKVDYSSDVYDAWFSEESGLTTDNKRWTNGMSESMGWYALHRFNKNQYTCNYLHSANSLGKDGYGDNLGEKIAVRDCGRNTLPIEKGYFVLDLRDWQGYKPLYLPYSQAYIQSKWQRGMIKFEYR